MTHKFEDWRWVHKIRFDVCEHCGATTRMAFFTRAERKRFPACSPLCAEAARNDRLRTQAV